MRDGGPAYPTPTEYPSEGYIRRQGGSGMSLRDYFAGQAMQGLLAANHQQLLIEAGARDYQQAINSIATEAYQYAEAMLESRRRYLTGDKPDA